MKNKKSFYHRVTYVLFSGGVMLLLALAGGCKEKNPLTLKQVMAGLEKDMTALQGAIYMQDYAAIEKHARAIADHPKPMKAQRKKIIEHLGERAERFQGHDMEVHSTASELAEAALVKALDKIGPLAAKLQSGCHSCHFEFQKEIHVLLAEPNPAPEVHPAAPAEVTGE